MSACRAAHAAAKAEKSARHTGSFDYPAVPPKKRQPVSSAPVAPLPPRAMPPVLIGDAEIGTPVKGAELEIGDLIVHLGRRHKVLKFEPYRGGLRAELGGMEARTAVCEGGLQLPHGPHSNVYIAPRGEQ